MAASKSTANKTVDWKKLRHAQGPATRSPTQIASLCYSEADARDEAFFALNDTLYAAGQWFTASEPAAELLLDLATSAKEGAHRALWLAADIVACDHVACLVGIAGGKPPAPPSFVAAFAIKNEARILRILRSSDGRLRSAAALLIAFLPTLHLSSLPAITAAAEVEPEPTVLASMLLAVAILWAQTNPSEDFALFAQLAGKFESPLLRGIGGLSVLLTSRGDTSSAIDDAATALLEPKLDTERFYWGHARVTEGAVQRLVAAVARGRGVEPDFVAVLLGTLHSKPVAKTAQQVAELILDLASFKRNWPRESDVALVGELDDLQRRVAHAFAQCEGLKLGWGLPPAVRDRRRWLGIEKPSSFEKIVTVSERDQNQSMPFWYAWRNAPGDSAEIPEELATQLTPMERVEVLLGAALGGYGILQSREASIDDDEIVSALDAAGSEIEAWAGWIVDFIAEVRRVFASPELASERGGEIEYPAEVPMLLGVIRSGQSIRPEWDGFLSWTPGNENREVLAAVPMARREAAIHSKLLQYANPATDTPSKWVMPILDLVPSRRITEILLAKLRNHRARGSMGTLVADQHLARIAELAKTEPGIRAALEAVPAAG